MRAVPPIELLNYAAEKLGDLCPEVVFLGGAVVSLLTTEKGGLPPRFTNDVDVAIEISGFRRHDPGNRWSTDDLQ